MTDRPKVHPRTRFMHNEMRLRNMRRRQSLGVKRVASRQGIKTATVIDVAPNGDVKIDRMTDENGNGEWLTPVNGRTPAIGQTVAVVNIEGALAVMGPVGEGEWKILPDHALLEPFYYFPDDSYLAGLGGDETLGTYNWDDQQNHPYLAVDPMNPRVYFGAPPFFAPNAIFWQDHFIGGNVTSGSIGKEGWTTAGNGSVVAPSLVSHYIRLNSGTTTGNTRAVWLGPNGNRTAMRAGASDDGIMESWFVCRLGNGANVTYRLGFGNDVMSASDPIGIWWEFDSTTMNAMAKLRVNTYNVDQAVFPWVTDQTYVISVRTEPDRSGDEYYGSLFTWTRWGFHATYPGGLYPVQQLVHLEGEHSGMSGGPEFGLRTSNNSQKVLDVDYAGGFVYDGNFQPIW